MTSSDRAEELLASGCFGDQIPVVIDAFDPGFFGMTLVAAAPGRLKCCP